MSQKPEYTAENPMPVRVFSAHMSEYIGKLNRVWLEGQIIDPRPYGNTVYLSLRDTDADIRIGVVADRRVMEAGEQPLADGSKVVMLAGFEWHSKRGEVKARAYEVQALGLGDLMARIEKLRAQLTAEGIFDSARKRPLPFLPRKIGLITGRDTDAMQDVRKNAKERWPAAQFVIKEIQLQTKETPLKAVAAMHELEAHPEVDVIIFARGGGSFEDLLPWSDEGLVRAVAKCLKPVISAIGHENDRPLLDDAADVRASTPTHAAALVVPSLEEETSRILTAKAQLAESKRRWLRNETTHLRLARDVLKAKSPRALVEIQQHKIAGVRQQLTNLAGRRLQREQARLSAQVAKLTALSPFAVLARGYAVATSADGTVLRSTADIAPGGRFELKLHEGAISATRDKE